MKSKKIIASVLALAMVCGALPSQPFNTVTKNAVITADAADLVDSGKCGENVTWTLDSEGTLTISGTGEMRNYNIFESPFYENQKIKNVIIEDGVTSIGANAFECCWLLNKITIPDSVTSIGVDAFYECESLHSVTIPDSVTSIDDCVFEWCLNLTSITIPASVTSIGKDVFWGCEEVTIKGYSGSYAQEYAEKNNIPFVAIGSQSVTTTTTTAANPASKTLYGDSNCDGSVNLADAVLILQSISSPDKFGENGSDKNHITAQGAKNADVYERGSGLTPQDALQIQKYLSKLITTLE